MSQGIWNHKRYVQTKGTTMKDNLYNPQTGHIIKDRGPYYVYIGYGKQRHFVSVRAAMQAIRKNPTYGNIVYYDGERVCALCDGKFIYASKLAKRYHATNKPFYMDYKG